MSEYNSLLHEVFNDSRLNSTLQEQGYIIVPFLNKEEVGSLVNFFETTQEKQKGQFTTFVVNDYKYRKSVNEEIAKVFGRAFKSIFKGYLPFWGNFFIKYPGSSAMPLHADLQYVKEPENISLNIWCPLSDANAMNGTLGIVPYSHKIINQIRGTNITESYRKNAKEIENAYGKPLALKAGEAIIYDHRLLHYSLPNQTNALRLAATLVVVPEDSELLHYYAEREGDTTIYKFAINSVEDFLRTEFLQKPSHLSPAEIFLDYKLNPVSLSDIQHVHKNLPLK